MTIRGNFGDPRTERDIRSAKRFNFFALVVLIAALATAFLMYLELVHQQQQLQLKSKELADSTANLRRIRGELEAAQGSLADRQHVMEQQVQRINVSIENKDFDSAKHQANALAAQIAKTDSSGFTFVHLYMYRPQDAALKKIDDYLRDPNFLLIKQETMQNLPSWMGQRSAVYYYSTQAAAKATEIAGELSRLAGQPFDALLGKPADAPPAGRHDWIHIHYLGTSNPGRNP